MSEFTLPANSKVGEGKRWPLPQKAEHVKIFHIYRWDPAKKANPTLDTFEIDRDHCGPMARSPKILLIYIQYSKTSEVNSL